MLAFGEKRAILVCSSTKEIKQTVMSALTATLSFPGSG